MPIIKVDIQPEGEQEDQGVKVAKPQASMEMKARKTLDGNMLIYDHVDIDIVIVPEASKIIAFAKESMGDHVYDAQNRLFKFLSKKGVVDPSTVQGGSVHSSLEGEIVKSVDEGVDPVQTAMFLIGKHLEQEKPFYTFVKDLENSEVEDLTDPTADESTELGEVPHQDFKGSVVPGLRPYGMLYRIWEGKEK